MSDVGCRQGDEATEEEAEAVAAYENYFLSERGELRLTLRSTRGQSRLTLTKVQTKT